MATVTSLKPLKGTSGSMTTTKALPYVTDGQLLPAKQPQQPIQTSNFTPEQIQQGTQDVLGTAQQLATQKAVQPNPITTQLQQRTQELLQKPEITPSNYVQSQVDKLARTQSDAFKTFQQQYADRANTGAVREGAFNLALQGAQQRSELESGLELEKARADREALLQAIGFGQDVAKTASGLDTEAFNRLIATRQAGEGERAQTSGQEFTKEMTAIDQAFQLDYLKEDQAGQQVLAQIQGKIQKGLQLDAQDFAGAQAALDRAQQLAVQANDIEGQKEITRLKGEIDTMNLQTQIESNEKLASMDIEWKRELQDSVEALTKEGWTHDEAMQQNTFAFEARESAYQRELERDLSADELGLMAERLSTETKLAYDQMTSEEKMAAAALAQGREIEDDRIRLAYEQMTRDEKIAVEQLAIERDKVAKDYAINVSDLALKGQQIGLQSREIDLMEKEAADKMEIALAQLSQDSTDAEWRRYFDLAEVMSATPEGAQIAGDLIAQAAQNAGMDAGQIAQKMNEVANLDTSPGSEAYPREFGESSGDFSSSIQEGDTVRFASPTASVDSQYNIPIPQGTYKVNRETITIPQEARPYDVEGGDMHLDVLVYVGSDGKKFLADKILDDRADRQVKYANSPEFNAWLRQNNIMA